MFTIGHLVACGFALFTICFICISWYPQWDSMLLEGFYNAYVTFHFRAPQNVLYRVDMQQLWKMVEWNGIE